MARAFIAFGAMLFTVTITGSMGPDDLRDRFLFTLTKSCNRHRVDPFAYLRDVYTQLPTTPESELESLLPDRWIAAHPEHVIQERITESQQRAQRTRTRRQKRRRQHQ